MYTVDDSLQVYVGREGNGLFVQVEEQLRMTLIPTLEGFYAYEARAEFIFSEDSSGEVTGVTLHQDGEHKGVRVQETLKGSRHD